MNDINMTDRLVAMIASSIISPIFIGIAIVFSFIIGPIFFIATTIKFIFRFIKDRMKTNNLIAVGITLALAPFAAIPMGLLGLILSPIIVVYKLVIWFFRFSCRIITRFN